MQRKWGSKSAGHANQQGQDDDVYGRRELHSLFFNSLHKNLLK